MTWPAQRTRPGPAESDHRPATAARAGSGRKRADDLTRHPDGMQPPAARTRRISTLLASHPPARGSGQNRPTSETGRQEIVAGPGPPIMATAEAEVAGRPPTDTSGDTAVTEGPRPEAPIESAAGTPPAPTDAEPRLPETATTETPPATATTEPPTEPLAEPTAKTTTSPPPATGSAAEPTAETATSESPPEAVETGSATDKETGAEPPSAEIAAPERAEESGASPTIETIEDEGIEVEPTTAGPSLTVGERPMGVEPTGATNRATPDRERPLPTTTEPAAETTPNDHSAGPIIAAPAGEVAGGAVLPTRTAATTAVEPPDRTPDTRPVPSEIAIAPTPDDRATVPEPRELTGSRGAHPVLPRAGPRPPGPARDATPGSRGALDRPSVAGARTMVPPSGPARSGINPSALLRPAEAREAATTSPATTTASAAPAGQPTGRVAPATAPEASPGLPPPGTSPGPPGLRASAAITTPNTAVATGSTPSAGSSALDILTAAPPSQASRALITVRSAAVTALAEEQRALQQDPPRIAAPSGLPTIPRTARTSPTPAPATGTTAIEDQVGAGPDRPTAPPARAPTTSPLPDQSTALATFDRAAAGEDQMSMAGPARRAIAGITTRDPGVVISAGRRPTVPLTGEADPGRLTRQTTAHLASIAGQGARARAEMAADDGVASIAPDLPDATLSAHVAPSALTPPPRRTPPAPNLPDDLRAPFDAAAATRWEDACGGARAEHDQALAERATGERTARAENDQRIADAEANAAARQHRERVGAGVAAAAARSRWSADLAAADARWSARRTGAEVDMARTVATARARGSTEVAQELQHGEREAAAERRKAEGDARARRQQATRELQQSDGFAGWLRSRVRGFLNGLRRAVDTIFSALRAAVRRIIEAAKRAAAAAIERARSSIVTAIRSAGRVLEAAASTLLAAFPAARDRALALIRSAMATAEAAVDRIARALRDAINALLDALGLVLDAILAAYAAVFTALISALEFVAVGLIEIMQGLARLGQAATAMPDHFEGQVEQELMGADLTQPLPFERAREPDPTAAEAVLSASAAGAGELRATPDQISVEEVTPFEPEPALIRDLALEDGDEEVFGENDDPTNSVEALMAEAVQAPSSDAEPEEPGPALEGPGETPAMAKEERPSDEEMLQRMIDAPLGGCPETGARPAAGGQSEIPESARIGPLSRSQRARFLLAKMGQGIAQWVRCNIGTVVAIVAGVLVGIALLIVAEILTGGLITAALPFVMGAVAAIFIGISVIKAADYLGEYLTKSWDGDIPGGARSLARALAVGAVELIFALLTYITAGAFRAVAAVARGVGRAASAVARGAMRVGSAVARGTNRAAAATRRAAAQSLRRAGRAAARVTGRAGSAVLRRGRLVMQGLRPGFARGARTLDDLTRRLRNRLRFRRFRIRRRGRHIRLFGYINPWVLLADGTYDYFEQSRLTLPGRSGPARVGDLVRVGRRRGVVVGSHSRAGGPVSQYMQELAGLSRTARRARYRELSAIEDIAERQARIRGAPTFNYDEAVRLHGTEVADAIGRRGRLASALGAPPASAGASPNAHHIFPVELIDESPALREAIRSGFNFNGGTNGRWLSRFSSRSAATASGRHAYHPNYTDRVRGLLANIDEAVAAGRMSGNTAKQRVTALAERLGRAIDSNPTTRIDDLIF